MYRVVTSIVCRISIPFLPPMLMLLVFSLLQATSPSTSSMDNNNGHTALSPIYENSDKSSVGG